MKSFFENQEEEEWYKEYLILKKKQRQECESNGHQYRTVTYCKHCGEPLGDE